MSEPYLVLDGLDKRFGSLQVLDRVSLSVEEGEVLALLGPSGSGKTTLLRLLAGFETPDGGAIRIAGRDVVPLPPERRRFGMVFQHYALFPHLAVGENVAFGLEAQGVPRGEHAERVAQALSLVDLAGFERRRVGEISGGQQQRVALARALATEPRVLLLDEPLSNLDPALRERTRRELSRAIERVGITTVLVTHEQEEAFDLGGRVAVLHAGRLQQVGAPETLYEAPATRFVATFVGRASVLAARAAGAAEAGEPVVVELGAVEPGGQDGRQDGGQGVVAWPAVAAAPLAAGQREDRVVRPETLRFAGGLAPGGGATAGEPGHGATAGGPGAAPEGAATAGRVGSRQATGEPAPGSPAGPRQPPASAPPAALAGEIVARRYGGPSTWYVVRLADGAELEVMAVERRLTGPGAQRPLREGEPVRVVPASDDDAPPPRAFPREDEA